LIAGSGGKYNLATIFRPEDDQIRLRVRAFLEKLLPLVSVALFPVPRFQRKRKLKFTAFATGKQFQDRTSKGFQP
jgi:hypothetical protein